MVEAPSIVVRPLTDADRRAISTWHYPGELAIYDPGAGAFDLHPPDHVALASENGELLGYGTLGQEAQVPGGLYDGDAVVDVGLGLHPDRIGSGHGRTALSSLLAHAAEHLDARRFRATVASSNARATAFVLGAGFVPTHHFVRADGRAFTQYERPTDSE